MKKSSEIIKGNLLKGPRQWWKRTESSRKQIKKSKGLISKISRPFVKV